MKAFFSFDAVDYCLVDDSTLRVDVDNNFLTFMSSAISR